MAVKLQAWVSRYIVLGFVFMLVIFSGCGSGSGGSTTSTVSPATITKTFGATTISMNGSTSLTFNLANPNTSTSLTGVGFTDALPAGLVIATPNALSGTCGGITPTAIAGSGSVSLSGATLSASASCGFSVKVMATTAGTLSNTTSAVTSNEGGTGKTASASITVGSSSLLSPPTIAKTFGAATISINSSTSLTFNLANPNTGSALTGVGFTDSLPAGLVVATPNALSGNCGAGTITATAGSGSVSLSGATLSAGSSCSFSANVTGTAPGALNNTTSAVTSNEGGTGKIASASVTVSAAPGSIQHVVVIFQENRTPDNLFQDPVLISRGADIAQSGLNSLGKTIQFSPIDLGNNGANPANYDLTHTHAAFKSMYDGGKMDGANLVSCYPPANCPPNANPNPQYVYVIPADVAPYFAMAEQYTFADRMFQTNQGESFPAHQFILSGTSAPTATSNLFAADDGESPYQPDTGCDAPPGSTVPLVGPSGIEDSSMFPCFEHPTLTDLLEANGNTWRYYAASGYAGGQGFAFWIAPEAIQHICEPLVNGVCGGTDFTDNVVLNPTQVLTDIANNQLADVSWVTPTGQASDHSGPNDGSGPSWVASVVNAIGNSPYWSNTAIFITWDDWGGFYDHVPPPQVLVNCAQWGCGYIYGFRVPLIVVSPYVKAQYISHQQHDFGSILKFIETTFNLPSLGYADALADDFSDCFNFYQTPLPFSTIAAPLNADYFLNDKTPPTDPDDD